MPKLAEQQQIANFLHSVVTKIDAEEKRKKAINELFRSMLSNLMSAKIRVNNFEV